MYKGFAGEYNSPLVTQSRIRSKRRVKGDRNIESMYLCLWKDVMHVYHKINVEIPIYQHVFFQAAKGIKIHEI